MSTSSLAGGAAQHIMQHIFGVGFESCQRDCVGASVTDALLAGHALFSAMRLTRRVRQAVISSGAESAWRRRSGDASFALLALGAILSNFGWSLLGTVYWLQPGGWHFDGFEAVWRLSARSLAS